MARRIRTLLWVGALLLAATSFDAEAEAARPGAEVSVQHGACKAKKKRPAKKTRPSASEEDEEASDAGEANAEGEKSEEEKSAGERGTREGEEEGEAQPPADTRTDEEKRQADIEAARRAAVTNPAPASGRKGSKITPGTASRWSNKGAMTPIESEVPITAEIPDRAVPVAPGVETPGQGLTGGEELLEARIYLSASHLETRGQDLELVFNAGVTPVRTPDRDRDIDLLRAHSTIAYERIAGSDFGLHLDLELRPRISGSRPTDHRLNELYVSYGLTDYRRSSKLDWGIALGRLAVREAGYAQADGALLRLRLSSEWTAGAFGGVTGNPYGYNWALRKSQEFSAGWARGGGFLGLRTERVFANAAAVLTYALEGDGLVAGSAQPGKKGLDRLYVYGDAAYLATETLNLMATGWIDVVGGHPFQSLELVAGYRPLSELDFRLGVGRFSTVLYDTSAAYSFIIDPLGNKASSAGGILVDEQGVPIVPFDSVLGSTIYNSVRARAGWQVALPWEVYANVDLLLRDTGYIGALNEAADGARIPFSSQRLMPGVGGRFHHPDYFDAALELTLIRDKESQADAVVRGSLGRGLFGAYLALDARTFFGKVPATDAGLDLAYSLPREWFPGRVSLRGMFRYFRESVAIQRPIPGQPDIISTPDQLFVLPLQESYLGYVALEWRL